jgi:hypothetical protein
MTRGSNQKDLSRRLWADRTKQVRVALDSQIRQGKNAIWSKELAALLRIPESAVRRMGLQMIDQVQVEGWRIRYAVGLWMIDRADLRLVGRDG